jgi:hypothetical protein
MAELGKAALLVGDQGTRPWKPEGGTEGGVDGGGFSFSFFRTSKGMKCKTIPEIRKLINIHNPKKM